METQWMVTAGQPEYQCPTTGQWFRPLSVKTQTIGEQPFVWVYCPHCDRMGRTRAHPSFSPLEPQPHCYTVRREREAGA